MTIIIPPKRVRDQDRDYADFTKHSARENFLRLEEDRRIREKYKAGGPDDKIKTRKELETDLDLAREGLKIEISQVVALNRRIATLEEAIRKIEDTAYNNDAKPGSFVQAIENCIALVSQPSEGRGPTFDSAEEMFEELEND